MRYAARVDANQQRIVSTLRAAGCFVQPLHQLGGGVPDLMVITHGRVVLMELKDGSKPPSARALTPEQVVWHARAMLHGVEVAVVTSEHEALVAVGVL